MAQGKRVRTSAPIIPAVEPTEALTALCPDLHDWPQRWRYQDADIALGERLVALFTPFLLHLLAQRLAATTLKRHRDHLWMLGGEVIRRTYDNPDLVRKPVTDIVLHLINDDCGPLIWPRITENQQNAFDTTCRKLYQFMLVSTEHRDV